jgi:hypothetical protein
MVAGSLLRFRVHLYFTLINYAVLLYLRIFTYCPVHIKIFSIASITAQAQVRRAYGKKIRKNKHSRSGIGYQYHTHWFTTGLASSHPSDKSLIFKNGGCVWHCLRPLPSATWEGAASAQHDISALENKI